MITKKGQITMYKPDLGESILAYSHKGTPEGQKLVAKLIKKFNLNVREKLPVQ
jgi:hypothetical protein